MRKREVVKLVSFFVTESVKSRLLYGLSLFNKTFFSTAIFLEKNKVRAFRFLTKARVHSARFLVSPARLHVQFMSGENLDFHLFLRVPTLL